MWSDLAFHYMAMHLAFERTLPLIFIENSLLILMASAMNGLQTHANLNLEYYEDI